MKIPTCSPDSPVRLLDFIIGLWLTCGSERFVVFTTNHIEKLEHALIGRSRSGRMDKRIEMSCCFYETFTVLAKRINSLDVESHELFEIVGRLLGETQMTPTDVVESLMLK
ncbi:putative P-loop containing nucleoside triphosphate hydrolase [Helianthus anomalus]